MPPSLDQSRPFWINRLEASWQLAPIAWMSGVRRSGKTTIAHMLDDTRFLNCDLPSVRSELEDPEAFFKGLREKTVVFDEVHRLDDPSMVLKIGADTRKSLRILATGSSTLAATTKFRDSLTERKREVNLQPVLFEELPVFGGATIEKRLLHGGMPQMLLAAKPDTGFYAEWLDSYFARDVAELFRIGKRSEFLLLLRLLLRQNGGMAAVVSLANQVGVSRPTVLAWLEVLRITHVIHMLSPFHGNGDKELTQQPKIYAFDTGFVAHENGWNELRPEERGLLWENVVLEHLLSRPSLLKVHHWRDKLQREIDFVIPRARGAVDAIECKWDLRRFETRGLKAFRTLYPKGKNFVIGPNVTESYTRTVDGLELTFGTPSVLA